MKKFFMAVVLFASATALADECSKMDLKYREYIERAYYTAIGRFDPENVANSIGEESISANKHLQVAIECSSLHPFCGEVKFVNNGKSCQLLRKFTGDQPHSLAHDIIMKVQKAERAQKNLPH